MTPVLGPATDCQLISVFNSKKFDPSQSRYLPGSGSDEMSAKDPKYCSSVRHLYNIMHFKGDRLRQTQRASAFLDISVGGHIFQTLVDTGNLSRVNLLDYNEFKAIRALNPSLKLSRESREIHTAGYHKLKGKGIFSTQVKLGKSNKVISTQFYVVQNLGVQSILSADTIAKISLILDLSRAQARLGGENGLLLKLKPYNANRKMPYPTNLDSLLPNFKFLKEEDLSEPQFARVGMQAEIEPHSVAMVHLSVPSSTRNKQPHHFEFHTKNPKLEKCITLNTLLFCQERTKCNNKVNLRKWLPKGVYVQLVNCSDETVKIPTGTVLGTLTQLNTYNKQTRKFEKGLRGSDLHATSEPLKLIPIPEITKLKNKSLKELKQALDKYMGINSEDNPKVLKEMKNKLDELNKDGIKNDKSLTPEKKELLYHVLLRFYKIFSKSQYDVGLTDLVEFKIETGDAEPIKAKTRPMNPPIQKALREHLQAQLKEGILAPGNGPWASAVVVVLKKNGEIRFVFDFRAVNKVTVTDSYPIAHQQMAIATEEFRKAESFISLDLAGAYLAVPVEKESQDKLAITTCEGLYKCLRMPFGAKNACGCYARLMRLVFNDMMMRRESLSFFDDHLIVCPDFLTGLFRLCKFLFAVEKANLRVSLKKSHFFVKKVEWLGFEATAGELLPSDRHIEKVKNWPEPKDSDEIASFYGLASYHRRFIKDFATIARPLKQVQAAEKETGKYEWTPAAQKSFDELKEKLITKPILAHPDFDKPFILSTDASLYAMGAELSQIQDGDEKVIAYASKLFSKRQMNYSVTRKELLAIVTFIKEFKYYLQGGKPFKVRTDHSALTWFKDSKSLTGQLWRWFESLNGFEYTIEHRAGLKHGNADALSRYPYPKEEREKVIPHLTELDKEMYEKCGMKPPTRNSIGRKIRDEQLHTSKKENEFINHKPEKIVKGKTLPTVHFCSKSQNTQEGIQFAKKGKLDTPKFDNNQFTSKEKEKEDDLNGQKHSTKPINLSQGLDDSKKMVGENRDTPTDLNIITRSNRYGQDKEIKEPAEQIDVEPEIQTGDSAKLLEQELLHEATPTLQKEGEFLEIGQTELEPETAAGREILLQHDTTETIKEKGELDSTAHDIDKCQCVRPDFDPDVFRSENENTKSVVINRHKLTLYNVSQEQKKDPLLRKVYGWIQRKERPLWSNCITQPEKEYYKRFQRLVIENNQIMLNDSDGKKICVPSHLVVKAIDLLHQHPLSGHIGIYRTHQRARKIFYWPSMTEQIEKAINSCSICLRAKQRKPKKQVPMGQTSTAVQDRLKVFYADLVGPWIPHPLPGKYQYLLTLTDAFTKFPEAIPIPRADTTTVLRALATHIIPRYGVGMTLVTDNGSQFTSQLFEHACKSLGLLTAKTQAYEPHSNPVERMHRTLESAIRALMLQDGAAKPSNWSDYVPAALASIRQSPLSTLPYSPHFLLYGEEPITPAHRAFGALMGVQGNSDTTGFDKLKKAMDQIRAKQLHNHEINKKYYDKKVYETPIKEGDMVYLYTNQDNSELGNLRKTSTYYKGPYAVTRVINARQIEIDLGQVRRIVSRDRLLVIPDPALSQELQLLRRGRSSSELNEQVEIGNVWSLLPDAKRTQRFQHNRSSNITCKVRSRSHSSPPGPVLCVSQLRSSYKFRPNRRKSVCTLFTLEGTDFCSPPTAGQDIGQPQSLEPPIPVPRKPGFGTQLGTATNASFPFKPPRSREHQVRNSSNSNLYQLKNFSSRLKNQHSRCTSKHATNRTRTEQGDYCFAYDCFTSTPVSRHRRAVDLTLSPVKNPFNESLSVDIKTESVKPVMAKPLPSTSVSKITPVISDPQPKQAKCVWILLGTRRSLTHPKLAEFQFFRTLLQQINSANYEHDFATLKQLELFFNHCKWEDFAVFPLYISIFSKELTFVAKRLAQRLGIEILFQDSASPFVDNWEQITRFKDLKDLPEPSLKKKGQGLVIYQADHKPIYVGWNKTPGKLSIEEQLQVTNFKQQHPAVVQQLPQQFLARCFNHYFQKSGKKEVLDLKRVRELANGHDFSYKPGSVVKKLNSVVSSGIRFLQPKASSEKFDMLSYSLSPNSWFK